MSATAKVTRLSRRTRLWIVLGVFLAATISGLCAFLILYLRDDDVRDEDYPYVLSSYDWAVFEQYHPVDPEEMIRLPEKAPVVLPRIQFPFEESDSDEAKDRLRVMEERAEAVKAATLKTWTAYRTHAWGHDELTPVSLGFKDTYGGWGATLVDSLDTLFLMGLHDEFYDAVRQVALIDWADEKYLTCNVFETNIRYLGGLLSAYDLSSVPVLLNKAVQLADMLLVAFDTPNRMPPFYLAYETARAGLQEADAGVASASPGSLSLEFTRLAQLTGDNKYYDAVHRITLFLASTQNMTNLPGMWPRDLDFKDLSAEGSTFTLGANADSLYEYLLKMHLLMGGAEPLYLEMYAMASEVARGTLFRPMLPPEQGESPDVLFAGTAEASGVPGEAPVLVSEGQHLACFTGGLFAVGGKILEKESHVEAGERLARGCAWGYSMAPHGILPERFLLAPCPSAEAGVECSFDLTVWQDAGGGVVDQGPFTELLESNYILRPEATESLFIQWRITGKEEFRDMAWEMWGAIMAATETEDAFTAVRNVMIEGKVIKEDSMESFWVAETLKYFWLMFKEPGVVSLDEWVFNTEAHPFKRSLPSMGEEGE